MEDAFPSERTVALEAGLGIVVGNTRYTHEDQYNVVHKYSHYAYNYGVANVGFRVQPKRTGLMWRLYWAPNWVMGPDHNNQKTLMWFSTSLAPREYILLIQLILVRKIARV